MEGKEYKTRRLNETELRIFYLENKVSEKIWVILSLWMLFVASAGIVLFSILVGLNWFLLFLVLTIGTVIFLLRKYSNLMEEIFNNRIF